MAEHGGDGAEQRRRWYLWALVALALVSVLRLVNQVRDGDTDSLTWTIAILVVLVIVVVTLWVVTRRIDGLARRVAALRPGAAVVPATTASEMLDVATALGVSRANIAGQGGSVAALAVLPDRIEVWFRKDEQPRWVLDRATLTSVHVAPAVFGSARRDALWVVGATGAAVVVPAYRPLRATAGAASREDLERALQAVAGTGVSGTV
ncbi:hypothetical protein [Luteimicrobium subarcticum]|uniref:Uncharacterized protein n=1 Tax=Luteimicrobium subarcticum TaxID=620910 RepID=A0A2M8WVK9_9MICO|nr:hypothetical protein [Luteimicrobium subarcticum]PJI94965.1 hypothetical protein CLV34_0817 [Luteimicrobium subarcticum]